MLVRCLRSSFAARRFFCSSSIVESSISSTVATKAPKQTNTEVSTQGTTDSNNPATHAITPLAERLFRIPQFDSGSAASVISKWKDEGRVVSKPQILFAVNGLKHRRCYSNALMICDAMLELTDFTLSPHEYAFHIDLIFRVRGLQSAEIFFNGIPEEMKGEITSTAFLHIIVQRGETAKAEALMEKMKKSGFLSNPEPYIHMMSLYIANDQFDKAGEMDNEVKKCIPRDLRIYNMWLNAYASRENLEGVERVFAQMMEAKVIANWLTHATIANMYIKKKMFEKASAALKDMVDVAPPSQVIECTLLTMHGNMGNKDEVMQIVGKLQSNTKTSDDEYGAMVRTLLKLGLFEKAEEIYKEWQSRFKSNNFSRNPIFFTTSAFLKRCRMDRKMSPNISPERTEEDKVEPMVQSDLGLKESQQL